MTGEDESSPQQENRERGAEYRRQIARLFEIGLDADDIYAWHGTSIEAIRYLAEHGRLPAQGRHGSEFFYVPEGIGSTEGDQRHAQSYAEWNAWKFYVLERLPFRPKDMERFSGIDDDEDELKAFFEEEAKQHGMTLREIEQLIREAKRTRKGVLLTISKKIQSGFIEYHSSRVSKDEKFIDVPGGLPIEYITGIEPLGDYEWKELVKIQESIDK